MPQLPSGKHVGITAKALQNLFDHLEDEGNYDRLKKIESISDIYPYVEILYFRAVVIDEKDKQPTVITGKLPSNLKEIPSGYYLSDKKQIYADWSKEDQLAFESFIALDAINEYLEKRLAEAQSIQAKIFVGMFRLYLKQAGLLDGEKDPLDTAEFDTYNLIAAIGCCASAVVKDDNLYSTSNQAFNRLTGVWPLYVRELNLDGYTFEDEAYPSLIAWQLRQDDVLKSQTPKQRSWFEDQVLIEAIELWDHANEDALSSCCPRSYTILQLAVTLTPAKNNDFTN